MRIRLLVSCFIITILVASSFAGEIHQTIRQGGVEKLKQLAMQV